MERNLIVYCLTGILLGLLVVLLPLSVSVYYPAILSEQQVSSIDIKSSAINVGLIITIGFVFAAMIYFIVRRNTS